MSSIENLIRKANGHSFANIKTTTNPCKTSKKIKTIINELGHESITKISNRNVSIGNQYENAVKNRLEKNNKDRESFKAIAREWAERICPGLVQHKESGQMYLEYYYLSNAPTTSIYVWENGDELTKEELRFAKENLFKKTYASNKQKEAGLTEEEQVRVNIVKMENVISVKAFGEYATNA